MRKWIALVTSSACAFSSLTFAEEMPTAVPTEENAIQLAVSPEISASEMSTDKTGAAAQEGSTTAKSGTFQYILIGTAAAAAATALILISKPSHGHHHHHSHQH
jgi:hypothetical protein